MSKHQLSSIHGKFASATAASNVEKPRTTSLMIRESIQRRMKAVAKLGGKTLDVFLQEACEIPEIVYELRIVMLAKPDSAAAFEAWQHIESLRRAAEQARLLVEQQRAPVLRALF